MSALLVRTSSALTPPMVVTVAGAIDIAAAPQLRSRLDAVPDRGTVVDLAGVTLSPPPE
jgi:anti-anti-sigma regulatory factor